MTSSSKERLVGDIFPPPARSPEQQAAIDYMEKVAFPRNRARFEQMERAYFGEIEGERSQRKIWYGHDWLVLPGQEHTTEIAADASLLVTNCSVPLMLSADAPDQEPVFGPDYIRFNGRGDTGEDFTYPPAPATRTQFKFLGSSGKCCTERRDYDLLVCALLLSIRHHMTNGGLVRSNGAPDSAAWLQAFDLYAKTFPDREIPWLTNWPKRSQKAE